VGTVLRHSLDRRLGQPARGAGGDAPRTAWASSVGWTWNAVRSTHPTTTRTWSSG